MARDLETGTIGRELRSDVDYFFKGEVVPNNTTVYSNGLRVGKTQDALEIVAKAATEITTLIAEDVSLVIQESSDDGDTDAYVTIATPYAITGANTVEAGTELFRYTPSTDKEVWIRLGFVSTSVGESGTVDAYPAFVAR